jgi:uncharacterized protein YbbC (DUF1343 family)
MKRSNGNLRFFEALKYTKQFSSKSVFLLLLLSSCAFHANVGPDLPTAIIEPAIPNSEELIQDKVSNTPTLQKPLLGIDRLNLVLDSLRGKRIAVVGNQTSIVDDQHLVDTLLALKLNVIKVFAPEHGFRGEIDAGEKVHTITDQKTGLPIISLYGNNKKPREDQLSDIDMIIYDIQDVGVRFYTYISTLHYVMEACAENNKQLLVLDRPNPNGHYVDGPIREPQYRSFVGMHPVPIVYGMTIGEYAMMINGEGWLEDKVTCNLRVIPCKNYSHKTRYVLPVPPSPNLRSELAITLYPSLCLFEATTVSVGRGTERPFEVYGHPKFPRREFNFVPTSMPGAKNPMYENMTCFGIDLRGSTKKRKYELNLNYLIQAKDFLGDTLPFIDQVSFFDRLAGTSTLRNQINAGWTAGEIRETWKSGLEEFKKIRQKYLLYN